MINTGFSEISQDRVQYEGDGFWYCEIAVTGDCNFSCNYCNRFKSDINLKKICSFINPQKDLRHIQLTGGEPTKSPILLDLCQFIKSKSIRLGISTNGSATRKFYESLHADAFSISLDDYDYTVLTRRGYKHIETVVDNIVHLSKNFYVNVGVIIDKLNFNRMVKIIDFILGLGVADIKLSVSTHDGVLPVIGDGDYSKYPILNYRVTRFRAGKNMRGIALDDNFKCELMKNDIAIVGDRHYPCLVYAREKGDPIGLIDGGVRSDRLRWYDMHDPKADPICREFCMDFKCEYNRARTEHLRRQDSVQS